MSSPSRFVINSSIGVIEFVPNDALKQLPVAEQIAIVEDLKPKLETPFTEVAERVNPIRHSKPVQR